MDLPADHAIGAVGRGAIRRLRRFAATIGDRTQGAAAPPKPDPLPRISVIVPIHDTETYIEKCLRSIMGQTMQEIEIICVDDLSPDNSSVIVERLAREDSRISLIRLERNLGLGGARNTGIMAARGAYVTGVDSDDWIMPDLMKQLWDESGEGAADIVAAGYTPVQPDGTPAGQPFLPTVGHFRNDGAELNIFEFLRPSFWGKLWRKSLFMDHDIRFPEHMYFEDLAVMPQLLFHARDIRLVANDMYQYVIRAASITNGQSARHVLDHFKVFDILDAFLVKEGLHDRFETAFVERICRSLSFHAAKIVASDLAEAEKAQYLRLMLMLQVAYIEHRRPLQDISVADLKSLIRTTKDSRTLRRAVLAGKVLSG